MQRRQKQQNEKTRDEETVEYPLFQPGTSLMHYAYAAESQADFPLYAERLARYQEWAGKSLAAAEETETMPILVNYPEILNIISVEERKWKVQLEFTELVMENGAHCHIVGYWAKTHPKARTLDTLCSRTAYARLLTRSPHPGLEFNHHYEEVQDLTSRFHRTLTDWKRVATPEIQTGLACLYLLDFTPRDIVLVNARFPGTRIVGLTTPAPDDRDGKMIATILKARASLADKSSSPAEVA